MRRISYFCALVVLLAVSVAGFVAAAIPSPQAGASGTTVNLVGLTYSPKTITINVGDSITWMHDATATPHSVTADDASFDSSPSCPPTCLGANAIFTHTFSVAGTFGYHCRVHGVLGMVGTVVVVPIVQPRVVAVSWTATESARLTQMAPSLGTNAAGVQKTSTYIISFLLGFAPATPIPQTLPGQGSAVTYTDTWQPDELSVLDRVKNKFVLNDVDATRFSVGIVDFLLGLGGHAPPRFAQL